MDRGRGRPSSRRNDGATISNNDEWEQHEIAVSQLATESEPLTLVSGLEDVLATGFPDDWVVEVGDYVAVNLETKLAYPAVTPTDDGFTIGMNSQRSRRKNRGLISRRR